MNKYVWLFVLFCCTAHAEPLTNQINDFEAVEQQNAAAARDLAKVQADYARQQNDLKQAQLKVDQQKAAEQEKRLMQERAAANKAAELSAKAAQDKADARIKLANEERFQDKARAQAQEDEQLELLKQEAALKIQQEALETQRLKAKVDLETAIALDRAKSIEAETALARKKEAADIDIVQSSADAERAVGNGIEANLSGTGHEGLYKFLVMVFLVILVLIGVFIASKYYLQHKSSNNVDSSNK
ncbi:MAG: hypothetical protein D0531_09825 [Methylococcales bacterium]|nr:MAG: hypothetical protein D0531_09825 [Methylococcales bacterium]